MTVNEARSARRSWEVERAGKLSKDKDFVVRRCSTSQLPSFSASAVIAVAQLLSCPASQLPPLLPLLNFPAAQLLSFRRYGFFFSLFIRYKAGSKSFDEYSVG
ncbi:MAG: hypothetical protein FWC57_06935, partial [Endomicrobia bacterium]|nr:hypothetical protein [Endomicrobiia bacterium]